MKNFLKLLAFLSLAVCGYSQSSQRFFIATESSSGNFLLTIPNAKIYVCTYNTQNACDSYVSVYSDPQLTQGLAMPLTADVNGFYNYYVSTGTQVVEKVCAAFSQCYYNTLTVGTFNGSIGIGTITGVTPSVGLTGGGTSGNITLGVDIAVVPLLTSVNVFTKTQTAPAFVGNLTGNVTGNVSGTSGGLSGSPAVTVSSINISGCAGKYTKADGTGCGTPLISTIANVQISTGTTTIAANSCTTNTATSMPGVLITSAIVSPTPVSSTNGVVGWGSTGGLSFTYYVTANVFNWSVCNPTTAPITPSSVVVWNVGAK